MRAVSSVRVGFRAAAIAGVLGGVPSLALAVLRGDDPLASSRAAGALLGRPTVARGLVAHALVSVFWAQVLAASLPRRHPVAFGALGGVAIATLDLGVLGRRIPEIAALPLGAQLADHVTFGALCGAVIRSGRAQLA